MKGLAVWMMWIQVLITACTATTRSRPTRQTDENESLMIVDDNKVDASCRDQTFCTIKPAEYPEEKFNKMFEGYKSLPQPTLVEDLKTGANLRRSADDKNNCESKVTYEPLYTVKSSRNGPWRMVVQAPEHDYVQRVRLETCSQRDAPCFTDIALTSEFMTMCKETWTTWEVLVAKRDNGTEKIKTELPVCCSCRYKSPDFYGNPKEPEAETTMAPVLRVPNPPFELPERQEIDKQSS